MNKLLSILALAAAAILIPAGRAGAQADSLKNKLDIGMAFLTHGEICGGGLPRAAESTEDRSAFLFGRARLNLDYERKGLQAHAVIQNAAIWGMTSNQNLGLYEGWVKMSAPFGLFAQVGRVALSYDDERIIGTNDFATASKSHDVLRFGYEGHGHKAHAILAYNQDGKNVYYGTFYDTGAQFYKTMQTLWYHYDIPKFPLGASLLFMNLGLQAGSETKADNPPSVAYQQIMGAYLHFHPEKFSFEASYYRQIGKDVFTLEDGKVTKGVDAWMASAKAAYTPWDFLGFVIGYDYLSGDDYVPVTYGGSPLGLPYHATIKGFTPMYGSRTQFYGIMDYFYESAYINGFTPGLQNAYAGVTGTAFKNLSYSASYHYLAVATNLSKLSNTLGHSMELQLGYRFTKDISLVLGYTLMAGTETMARLKKEGSSNRAHWGWFSLVVSPSIFSTKW